MLWVPAEMHDRLRTVIVAPITTKGRAAPFRIGFMYGGQKGLILLDRMRAVDKARLARKLGAVWAKTTCRSSDRPTARRYAGFP